MHKLDELNLIETSKSRLDNSCLKFRDRNDINS